MNLWNEIEKNRKQMYQDRRYLHRHPELSHKEERTTKFIRQRLDEYGIEIEECGLKTGVSAIIRGAEKGKTIAIRQDIDALPVFEESGLEFVSVCEGVSHACGHDLHTAILLYCGKILQEHKEQLRGNVRLLFQPAEETGTGAWEMIQAGCMTNEPKPDYIVGVHTHPDTPAGKIRIRKGIFNAGSDSFKIRIQGKGGHGAYPHRCVDPIVTAAYVVTQLQTVISRTNSAVKPAVLSIGTIHGGTAANVIPNEVIMTGNLRFFYPESRAKNLEAMDRIVKNVCEAMGAKGVVEQEGISVPPLINDDRVVEDLLRAASQSIGEENILDLALPSPGFDDFSCYLEDCPGAQFFIGTANEEEKSRLGMHNSKVIFDERAMDTGVAVLVQYVWNLLKKGD